MALVTSKKDGVVPGSLHRFDADRIRSSAASMLGSRGLAVELEPLAEAVDVGRQMGADPEPVRPQQARHERASPSPSPRCLRRARPGSDPADAPVR